MKISFIIPAHNEEAVIERCARSVRAEIERAHADAEVIIVNNFSNDRTHERAAAVAGVRVIDEPRKGTNRARQTGFENSTGQLIANIDADSEMLPGWIDTVHREFERHPKLVALSGPYVYHDISGVTWLMANFFQFLMYLAYLVNRSILHVSSQLLGGNCVMRREALEKIGGYDTGFTFFGDDIDTARRLFAIGDVIFTYRLPIVASGRRFAKDGIFKTAWFYGVNFFSMLVAKKAVTSTNTDIRLPSNS